MAKKQELTYYQGVGRRYFVISGKDKTAKVGTHKRNQGETFINNKSLNEVYPNDFDKKRYLSVLEATDNVGRFVISITTKGGGANGQLEAIIHGLARALIKVEGQNNKPTLKKMGALTRDSRIRQRRMVGKGGKSRRKKQSPKR